MFLIHLRQANLEALTPFNNVGRFAFDGFFAHMVFPLPRWQMALTRSMDASPSPGQVKAIGWALGKF
jgi:hypothetical protein